MDEFGLTEEILEKTDVLIFWAHRTHGIFSDEIVERIYNRVMKGMGLIVLHSAHLSKVFKRLMGTSCTLKYRYGDFARIWTTSQRGYGKVFYFHPGHDTNSAYYNPLVLKVISNAVLWAAPVKEREDIRCEEYPRINLRKK